MGIYRGPSYHHVKPEPNIRKITIGKFTRRGSDIWDTIMQARNQGLLDEDLDMDGAKLESRRTVASTFRARIINEETDTYCRTIKFSNETDYLINTLTYTDEEIEEMFILELLKVLKRYKGLT